VLDGARCAFVAAVGLLAAACGGPVDPPDPPTPDPEPEWPPGLDVGDEIGCDDPTDGFLRLEQRTAERGLAFELTPLPQGPCVPLSGAVSAEDLDGDGDVDALLQNPTGFPHVLENDGTGHFTRSDPPFDPVGLFGRHVYGQAVVDLDDDRLPEVVLFGPSLVLLFDNLGDLAFGEPRVLMNEPEPPWGCIHAGAFGDLDGDGDLDLFVPQADGLQAADSHWEFQDQLGTPDLLLVNDGDGQFSLAQDELLPAGGPAIVLLATFTDRDGDGDADVLAPSDRSFMNEGRLAFYRNDDGELLDDAPDLGVDLSISGMGIATTDFNLDGLLDYCITDELPDVRCLTSDAGSGLWTETGVAMGLTADPTAHPEFEGGRWEGWSLELIDLDNDGVTDAATTAGVPDHADPPAWEVRPDALWQGVASDDGPRFEERAAEAGFNLGWNHYGMAAADFAADGYPDLLMGSFFGEPVFWDNPCGSGGWLDVELIGPSPNPRAIGALVTASWGEGRREVQEIQASRGLGQSPASRHFGVGGATTVDVEIRWPDGEVTSATGLPVRRTVTVRHPSLVE